MFKNWTHIQDRLKQKGADGCYLTAVAGNESDEELREIAENIMLFCPASHAAVGCPFEQLSKLTDQSLHSALAQISRKDLLELFEMERECRAKVFEATQL